MKYIVLIGDGMSDYPLDELNGRTPLESVKIPNISYIAEHGAVGRAVTVPRGMSPASDIANLSIIGYDPKKYYTGRGPLEAANIGVDLDRDDVAFRCNLVTISEGIMSDYSSGHITTKEAAVLIKYLDKGLGTEWAKFYPGVSYRHLLVIKTKYLRRQGGRMVVLTPSEFMDTDCLPPHNIIGEKIAKNMPKGRARDVLCRLMEDSRPLLEAHDLNNVRIDLKENPANMIWLWGQGTKPQMPSFEEKFGVSGSVISAVDLVKGIGKTIGLDVIDVPGATGYYDTDYKAKADYALRSLKEKDFVFVHVEAPDEAGHNGDLRAKLTAIENFDKLVVGTILHEFKDKRKNFRILVMPDHSTPLALKTHTSDAVPLAMFGTGIEKNDVKVFSETAARGSKFSFKNGYEIMEYFIKGHVK
ncbi:MAG: cofactor-independent phosphoglycerate mutase [Candidatus Omnitrophota bacterium]